jgi:hypothetical protein
MSTTDDKEAGGKEGGYSHIPLSTFILFHTVGLAASPRSCRTIAGRGQKPMAVEGAACVCCCQRMGRMGRIGRCAKDSFLGQDEGRSGRRCDIL